MVGRLVLAAVLAAALASAQGGRGGGGGGKRGDTGAEMPMRTQRQSPFEMFSDKLKLTKEQSTEAQNILSAAAQQVSPVRGELDKSRTDIAGALIDGKNGDDLKKLMDAQSALQAKLDGIAADAFSKIFATLKPNQQAKAGQAFEYMAAMFDRRGGGGGGGGGERRGGR